MIHGTNYLRGWDTVPRDGVIKYSSPKSIVTIHVEHAQPKFVDDHVKRPDNMIRQELAIQLGCELVKSGHATFYKHFDQNSLCDIVVAEVSVAPVGTKMCLIEDEFFSVNGELFSQKEIIDAIKKTYPERII